jgi:hypothetical protein
MMKSKSAFTVVAGFVALLCLTGGVLIGQQPAAKQDVHDGPGKFQIVATGTTLGSSSVFVLDTQSGQVWRLSKGGSETASPDWIDLGQP